MSDTSPVMEDESGAFVDRLRPLLAAGDLVAAYELLMGLEDDALRQAKQWFGASARWFRELGGQVVFAGEDHDEKFVVRHNAEWIVGMCAVRLCGPRTAAERVPWTQCWDYMEHDGEAALVQLLWDQPTGWVSEFVDAASRVRLGGQARNVNATLSRVLRAAVAHHGLPCPAGDTFLKQWLAGTPAVGRWRRPGVDLAEWLAFDPLMPDLLLRYLASGECGDWPGLPAAAGALVRADKIDRAALVEVVLVQLTTSQRPKSQRVLAGILGALGVRCEEVSGGLCYLLGVLATADRAVQPVLLPLALELATDSEKWRALTDVVASRPEKKAKELVLAALKKPGTRETAGTEAVASALEVLGAGDDAAFTVKVATVRDHLGLAAPEENAPVAPLGLWGLPPVPSGADVTPRVYLGHPRRDPDWQRALSSSCPYRDDVRPWLVEQALTEMAQDRYDGSAFLAAAVELLGRQKLLCSAVVTALEDLFLAGGLRHGWVTAVAVADLGAGAPKRPAGLADLVRLLVRYAKEVPDSPVLPPHLAALAADTARSKAVMEARRLAAALAGTDEETAAAALRAEHPVPAAPARRGLWALMSEDTEPLPSTVRITDDPLLARAATLHGLREVLAENFNGYSQSFADVCWWPSGYADPGGLTGLTDPDRVLAATVEAIHRHGPVEVRASLRGLDRQYGPLDLVAAVDAWTGESLDAATFWRLATGPVVSEQALMKLWREQGDRNREANERRAALPHFAERLRLPDHPDVGALVVPWELGTPLERFGFLRAAEALLRAESEPVLLSVPTWRDGTLGVEDLLRRLDLVTRRSGVVGPIDLVQALHRLREVDARLVDDVPSGMRTDPVFTDPDGVESWDATDMVQRWLASRGLPALEPLAQDGRWSVTARAPVPFTCLAAWPAELADDPWTPGPMPATLRLHPRWTDRVFEDAFNAWALFDPRHLPSLAAGPLGVPFHDRLLALLTTEHNRDSFQGSPTLVQLARWGRLDPAAAADAARGRHDAGTLSLSQLVRTLQRDFEVALRGLWPAALAIGDALSTVAKRPPQLADLLRLLTAFAHEVPTSAMSYVPQGLSALAESKGTTRAHEAARQLVGALRQAGAS
ncbi:MAG: hypothetical protein ACR2J5_07545 [Geodermatophilaceae bacterium]